MKKEEKEKEKVNKEEWLSMEEIDQQDLWLIFMAGPPWFVVRLCMLCGSFDMQPDKGFGFFKRG